MKKYTSLTTLVVVIAISILLSSCGKKNTTAGEGQSNPGSTTNLIIGSNFTTVQDLQNAVNGMNESAGIATHDQIFLVNSTVNQVSGGTSVNLFNLFSINISGGVYTPNVKEEELVIQSVATNNVSYLRYYDFGNPSINTFNKATLVNKLFNPTITGLVRQGTTIRNVSIVLRNRFSFGERTIKGYLLEHQMMKTTYPTQLYFIQYLVSTELPLLANPVGEFNNHSMVNRQVTGFKSEDIVRVF